MSRNRFVNARPARMTSDDVVPCSLVEDGLLAAEGGTIAHVGASASCPEHERGRPEVDPGGRPVTPAPIDCHTHRVFGDDAELPAPEPSP